VANIVFAAAFLTMAWVESRVASQTQEAHLSAPAPLIDPLE